MIRPYPHAEDRADVAPVSRRRQSKEVTDLFWARVLAHPSPATAPAVRTRVAGRLSSFLVGLAVALFVGRVIDFLDLSLIAVVIGASWDL